MTPIVVEFTVAASQRHAFEVWAHRTSLWWPRDHTMSGADDLDIVYEGHPGGRIFERTREGVEHDWGRIVEWDPPRRLAYSWHLFFDPEEATDMTVTFNDVDDGTSVRIEQTGWERLGAAGPPRRQKTNEVWLLMSELYSEACRTLI